MPSHERIGSALNSANLKCDELHTDIELVAALAYTSRLGAHLQHVVSAGQLEQLRPAVVELTRVLQKACVKKRIGISAGQAEMVSTQALREWIIKICRACNGTGNRLLSYTGGEIKKGQCSHCDGTGLFAPTWAWRREMLQHDLDRPPDWWDKRIEFAKQIAEDAYRASRRKVTVQTIE